MRILSVTLGVLVLLAGSAGAQVSTDLWDVTQGTVVTNSSGGTPRNMIGGMDINFGSGSLEPGIAFFDDGGRGAGFVHFVEFKTPQSIHLTGYHLIAGDDDANNPGDRGFTQFRLFAMVGGGFQLIDTYTPISNPYPDHLVDVIRSFPAIDADTFRTEIVQYANDSGPGPRIVELDAIATAVVPEPASVMAIAVLGAGTCLRRVRRRLVVQ